MSQNAHKNLYSILNGLASDLGVKDPGFKLEIPNDNSHGDLASNIALVLAKKLDKKPMEIANELVSKLITDDSFIGEVIAFEPGFINFYFSNTYLASLVQNTVNQGQAYGSSELGIGKKASVEYVSANPTGPLHIGNARGGPIGDVVANVLSKSGYAVTREYLHNDVGGQVQRLGEAIYYNLNPDKKPAELEVQYQGEYITELAQKVAQKLQGLDQAEAVKLAGEAAVEIMLAEILADCEAMGIKFDKITKESQLRNVIPQALEKLKPSLKEQEGALWFAPNDEFLKDRETVVRKSNGEYTYFASDIAYHTQKMEEYDIAVDVLGSNHSGHVPRLHAVINALGFDPKKLKVVLYQYVRLKNGSDTVKMSKRMGNFITAKEVLDEVGKDAFRFFLLMPRSQTHMDFDLELAKKKASDNPVFYVQYAYARMSSIFSKAVENDLKSADLNLLKTKEELNLVRFLIQFPNLVEEISQNLEVNGLVNYAIELSNKFHKFYETSQVITENSDLSSARLALLKATQITLKNTLDLLGVSAPEKM